MTCIYYQTDSGQNFGVKLIWVCFLIHLLKKTIIEVKETKKTIIINFYYNY